MNSQQFELAGKKVYIAGRNGLTGSAIERELQHRGQTQVLGHHSKEADFRILEDTKNALYENKPDVLVIAAARVGGIEANRSFPVDFLDANLLIQTNLMRVAFELQIPRLILLGSSCVYPKLAPQPIKEESLLTGELESTNQAYAIAKIAGLELIKSYRRQYGCDWISAMPCNLYGPGDNFSDYSSHVIPGLLKRFHDAKRERRQEVEAWGTGTPLREFLHVDDFAQGILFLLENYNEDLHLNLGSGDEISIKQLTQLITRVVDYRGDVIWNRSHPDGTPRKVLDNSRVNRLGWKASIPLEIGIQSTYKWLIDEFENARTD
jgi:GDP-L-fucose synthase